MRVRILCRVWLDGALVMLSLDFKIHCDHTFSKLDILCGDIMTALSPRSRQTVTSGATKTNDSEESTLAAVMKQIICLALS